MPVRLRLVIDSLTLLVYCPGYAKSYKIQTPATDPLPIPEELFSSNGWWWVDACAPHRRETEKAKRNSLFSTLVILRYFSKPHMQLLKKCFSFQVRFHKTRMKGNEKRRRKERALKENTSKLPTKTTCQHSSKFYNRRERGRSGPNSNQKGSKRFNTIYSYRNNAKIVQTAMHTKIGTSLPLHTQYKIMIRNANSVLLAIGCSLTAMRNFYHK